MPYNQRALFSEPANAKLTVLSGWMRDPSAITPHRIPVFLERANWGNADTFLSSAHRHVAKEAPPEQRSVGYPIQLIVCASHFISHYQLLSILVPFPHHWLRDADTERRPHHRVRCLQSGGNPRRAPILRYSHHCSRLTVPSAVRTPIYWPIPSPTPSPRAVHASDLSMWRALVAGATCWICRFLLLSTRPSVHGPSP